MEDHNQLQKQNSEPLFSDADYQQQMRVDPLTTVDAIKREYQSLQEAREKRTQLAANAANEKAEVEAQEEKERIIEERVAQRIALQSKSD